MGIQLPRATASDPVAVKLAADAGFAFVRNDMDWEWVDKGDGRYDFSIYDAEVELAAAHDMRMMYILISHAAIADPEHPRWNVATEGGRRRFAAFARAAAGHYKGRGVVWEIWNEPGGNFWKPEPDVEKYFALMVETAQALREADPEAAIIAPGAAHAIHSITKKEDEFLKALLAKGALGYIDGVSVHPYQAGGKPENSVAGYDRLREWMAEYGPEGKEIAIVSSEWGYEDFIKWQDIGYVRKRQARYVAREFLVNWWQGVSLQIYFTWRASKNYGLLEDDGTPKLAYQAASTLLNTLGSSELVDRLDTGKEDEYVLRFSGNGRQGLAIWLGVDGGAEDAPLKTRRITLPLDGSEGTLVDMLGGTKRVAWGEGGLAITVSEEPQYVVYERRDG